MTSIILTKQQLRQFMVTYHHLTDETALINNDEIIDYIHKVGCIQFDPLDVVGRNPDLVLQSRSQSYKKGDLEKVLYSDRSLFDVWDKNMSICLVRDWPYFSRFRKRYLPWCEEHYDTVEKIIDYLSQHDFACSSDFGFEDRVGWHYGPQRLAKAALECMCYAGSAVVHHKKGTRRYYGLSKRYIPEKLLEMADPNKTDEDYYKWIVLRRINSVGALWDRPSDAWLGAGEGQGLRGVYRSAAFKSLLSENKIVEVQAEGLKYPLYISRENAKVLDLYINKQLNEERARFIAPLDNMLWDRKLIGEVFGFEYKWEVYTPVDKRKYGYYVLPVLYNDTFIGRIEMETDKKSRALVVKAFWWENNIKPNKKYRNSIMKCLKRFAEYNICESIDIKCEI